MSRYWLNQFFADTQKSEGLAAFKSDPQAYLDHYQLSAELRDAVASVDVGALYQAGANPYLLRFFCVNIGVSETEYLGALRALKE
jgi:hypothetical protein